MARDEDEDEDDRKEREKFLKVEHPVVDEQVILAAAAASPEALEKICQAGVRPETFMDGRHAEIWRAFVELRRRRLEYDPATLMTLSSKIDVAYLGKLEAARPDVPPNLAHQIESLLWGAKRAFIAQGPLSNLVGAFKDPRAQPSEIWAHAQQVLDACRGHGASGYLRDAGSVGLELLAEIERRRAGQAVWPFGIERLDEFEPEHPARKRGERWRIYPGTAPGLITTLTGISNIGKSFVVARLVLGIMRQGRRVLWGTWEEGPRDGLEILACISLGLSRRKVLLGELSDEEVRAIEERIELLKPWVVFFDLPFGRRIGEKASNEKNLDVVHQQISNAGCEVAVLDIFNKCLVDREPRDEEKAWFRAQGIAIETKTHIVNTHQQRLGDLEKRDDPRPTREGVKGSKAVVEASDYLFGIHRPDFYKPLAKTTIEFHALKVKKGPCPWVVSFDVDFDRGILSGGKTMPYNVSSGKKKGAKAEDDFGSLEADE